MKSAHIKLTYLAAFFFVADVAVPRATFYSHTHKGGERAHVHLADDPGNSGDQSIDLALAEALGSEYLHPHHHHHHHPGDRSALEAPDDVVGTAHWHAQSPFQPAIKVTAPQVAASTLIAAAIVAEPEQSESAGIRRTRARSPPTL